MMTDPHNHPQRPNIRGRLGWVHQRNAYQRGTLRRPASWVGENSWNRQNSSRQRHREYRSYGPRRSSRTVRVYPMQTIRSRSPVQNIGSRSPVRSTNPTYFDHEIVCSRLSDKTNNYSFWIPIKITKQIDGVGRFEYSQYLNFQKNILRYFLSITMNNYSL